MNWHKLDVAQVLSHFNSSPNGLNVHDVERRLQQHGYNQLNAKRKKSAWLLLLGQFKDFMIIVLFGAAIIAGMMFLKPRHFH